MWYVLYTRPKAEKKVADNLEKLNIDVFCPMITELRQWSDRKKKIQVPLFRSYVFIRLKEKDRHKIFEVPGVVRYVFWLGKPALVRDVEINIIKDWLNEDKVEQVHLDRVSPGDRIIIRSGAFKDQEAIIQEVSPTRIRLILVALGCTVCAKARDVLQEACV